MVNEKSWTDAGVWETPQRNQGKLELDKKGNLSTHTDF